MKTHVILAVIGAALFTGCVVPRSAFDKVVKREILTGRKLEECRNVQNDVQINAYKQGADDGRTAMKDYIFTLIANSSATAIVEFWQDVRKDKNVPTSEIDIQQLADRALTMKKELAPKAKKEKKP